MPLEYREQTSTLNTISSKNRVWTVYLLLRLGILRGLERSVRPVDEKPLVLYPINRLFATTTTAPWFQGDR